MGIYGKAAIIAAKELQINKNANPRDIWKKSVAKFTDKKSSIDKGCPQTTFLYLCNEGHIKGVVKNCEIAISSKNCDYTKQMIENIRKNDGIIETKKELWEIVEHAEKAKFENGQSSIVFALLKNDLLTY